MLRAVPAICFIADSTFFVFRSGSLTSAISRTCSLLSFGVALAVEPVAWQPLVDAAWPVFYGGVLSVGVAYTLQVVAQRQAPASHAAIILSLETVFAALGGWWLLHEEMSPRGLAGCGLMFGGMLVSGLGGRQPD